MRRHVIGALVLALVAWTAVPPQSSATEVPAQAGVVRPEVRRSLVPAARCTTAWPAPLRDMTGYRRVRVGCTTTWTIEGPASRSTTARAILGARLDALRSDVYDTVGDTACSTGGTVRYCTRSIRLRGHPGVRGRLTVSHDNLHGWSKTRVDVFRVT